MRPCPEAAPSPESAAPNPVSARARSRGREARPRGSCRWFRYRRSWPSLLRGDAGAFFAEGFDRRLVLLVLGRRLLRRGGAVLAEAVRVAAAVARIVGHL